MIFTRAGIPYWSIYGFQNIKLTGLEVAILTHNDTHCVHVPYRPPLIAFQGVNDRLGKEGSMQLLCSDFGGSECNYSSRIYWCPVEEQPCVRNYRDWRLIIYYRFPLCCMRRLRRNAKSGGKMFIELLLSWFLWWRKRRDLEFNSTAAIG